MSEDNFKIIGEPSLPRDATLLQTAAWEDMVAKLTKADPEAKTWREHKIRNALTGYTIHIDTLPDGPAVEIAKNIRQYIDAALRNGDQPFEERVNELARAEVNTDWPVFIRAEFAKWLPETDGINLPEGGSLEMLAAFDDNVDNALRTLYDAKVRTSLAPDHDDFLMQVRDGAKSCTELEMEDLITSVNQALLDLAPESGLEP